MSVPPADGDIIRIRPGDVYKPEPTTFIGPSPDIAVNPITGQPVFFRNYIGPNGSSATAEGQRISALTSVPAGSSTYEVSGGYLANPVFINDQTTQSSPANTVYAFNQLPEAPTPSGTLPMGPPPQNPGSLFGVDISFFKTILPDPSQVVSAFGQAIGEFADSVGSLFGDLFSQLGGLLGLGGAAVSNPSSRPETFLQNASSRASTSFVGHGAYEPTYHGPVVVTLLPPSG